MYTPAWSRGPRFSSSGCVKGFLVSSAVEWMVSVTQVPPRVGGPPQGGCPPTPCRWAHPSTEGLDRTEGGGRQDLPFCTCLSVKLVSSHLLSPGSQAPSLGVTHTTCFLGPQAAARGTSQPPSSQAPRPHSKPPWGCTGPSSVALETSDCYRG